MSKNIFAHTAPGSNYPEYISINDLEGGIVEIIEIIVRSPAPFNGGVGSGNTAYINLTAEQFRELAGKIFMHACSTNLAASLKS